MIHFFVIFCLKALSFLWMTSNLTFSLSANSIFLSAKAFISSLNLQSEGRQILGSVGLTMSHFSNSQNLNIKKLHFNKVSIGYFNYNLEYISSSNIIFSNGLPFIICITCSLCVISPLKISVGSTNF